MTAGDSTQGTQSTDSTGADGTEGNADDSSNGDTIESEDITWLNGRAVERAGAFTRLAGVALVVAGAIGVAAWLWLTVRQQQAMDDVGGGEFGAVSVDVSLVDRIDAVVGYVPILIYGSLAVGAGLALRLIADYTVARTGGSLSGFAAGDPVPDGGLVNDPQPVEVDPFA
jgi:hypothetical protein